MGAIHLTTTTTTTTTPNLPILEEIPGLIKLYKDGRVDRPPAMLEIPSTWAPVPDVASRDVVINPSTGVWARFYVPRRHQQHPPQHPLLVYFHGGGFCLGSAAWSCYHEFLARLSSLTNSIVASVNYRLAPENRLPAAYDDGVAAVKWIKQSIHQLTWCQNTCNSNRMYLVGDSAGGAVAYNVAVRLGSVSYLRGLILIQPFFGGQARTSSEKNSVQSSKSALTLATSDCYWRLALPLGANRDHPWCNPKVGELPSPSPVLVCISERDILKDRNLEFVKGLRRRRSSGNVESVVYGGVGHAFQVLDSCSLSQVRRQEMMADIKGFINNYR